MPHVVQQHPEHRVIPVPEPVFRTEHIPDHRAAATTVTPDQEWLTTPQQNREAILLPVRLHPITGATAQVLPTTGVPAAEVHQDLTEPRHR